MSNICPKCGKPVTPTAAGTNFYPQIATKIKAERIGAEPNADNGYYVFEKGALTIFHYYHASTNGGAGCFVQPDYCPELPHCAVCDTQEEATLFQGHFLCNDHKNAVQAHQSRHTARVARLRASAEHDMSMAQAIEDKNKKKADIMAGTPVLLGHHSQRRHERELERIHRDTIKAINFVRLAQKKVARAAAAEDNPAIFADDPLAKVKLQNKIDSLKQQQDFMKAVNVAIRKATRKGELDKEKALAALVALGCTQAQAENFLKPDFVGRIGIPNYMLQNNLVNIKQAEARIADLDRLASVANTTETIGKVQVERDSAANRLRLIFPGKPSDEVRRLLKSNGFRWSPSNGAWQAYLSQNTEHNLLQIIERISQ